MNPATAYATNFAAQLDCLAELSVVQGDDALSHSFVALRGYVGAYGSLIDQVCTGFASIAEANPNKDEWKPLSYPIMHAGSSVMVAAAAELATRLRAIEVPVRAPKAPAWAGVKTSMVDSAKSAAATTATTIGAAAAIGVRSLLLRKNPFPMLADRIGRERIANAIERAKNPLGTLQSAAETLLPKLKQGLGVGVDLGNELSEFLASLVPDEGVDYITAQAVEELRLSAAERELTALKMSADVLEQSTRTLAEIGKSAVKQAAASAIASHLAAPGAVSAQARQELVEALAQLAHADRAAAPLTAKMTEMFGKLAAFSSTVREQVLNEVASGGARAPAEPPVATPPPAPIVSPAPEETPAAQPGAKRTGAAKRTPRPRTPRKPKE